MECWSREQNGLVFAGPLKCSALTWVWYPVSEEDTYIAFMGLGSRKEVLQVSPG